MGDWHGIIVKGRVGGYGRRRLMKEEDLEEEEVWSVMEEEEESPSSPNYKVGGSSSSSCAWRRFPGAPRKIPTSTHDGVAAAKNMVDAHQRSSAPVKIPDWSKIYGRKNNAWSSISTRDAYEGDDTGHEGKGNDDEEEEEGEEMVPPHELLARRLERTRISSFSVCEGVGRTLKGRDLSKLRNAILTKTGFLE
ncbi:hypothetical protein Tsubulata_032506 [Turnera subulata]|uniref:Senescence regulator n=1 Tax=Turnera subulata TaxID=218843 RepID=A0A9Q0FBP6_9ROSI|nr:hypothetical protein Tsubulata_032506 [Turnera subulata]